MNNTIEIIDVSTSNFKVIHKWENIIDFGKFPIPNINDVIYINSNYYTVTERKYIYNMVNRIISEKTEIKIKIFVKYVI